MNKITYAELTSAMREHNREQYVTSKGRDDSPIYGAVVFTEDTWHTRYPLDSRTYIFSSDNKAFIAGMGGYSIFASAKDGSDRGIRLEHYCEYEQGDWKVDYCYLCDKEGEAL